MEQCRIMDADVTIECYYSDYCSCDNIIPVSLFIWNNFFPSCKNIPRGDLLWEKQK